jgi:type IV pilus assembly protein PilV
VTISLTSYRHQTGLGLIEALVALIVLSVGLLGIAGLFVETLRANRSAVARMHAVNLVNDLADRILANRTGRASYRLTGTAVPASENCVVTRNCTTEQLARDDLASWVVAVRAVLPADAAGRPPLATVSVAVAASPSDPDVYRIAIEWTEPGEQRPFSYANTVTVAAGL